MKALVKKEARPGLWLADVLALFAGDVSAVNAESLAPGAINPEPVTIGLDSADAGGSTCGAEV